MADDTVFGGVNKFSGYFSAGDGTKAVVKISRSGGGTTTFDNSQSFFVLSYQIQWSRGVSVIRPLNDTGLVAQVGRGTGTASLTGMVGSLAAFKEVLGTGNDDICKPLTVTFDLTTMTYKCDERGSVSGNKIVLEACLPQTIQFTGQTEQQGMIIQQATLALQIGGLRFG